MLPGRVFYFNVVTKSAPYESPQSIRFMWAHRDRSERVRGHTSLRLRVVDQLSSVDFRCPEAYGTRSEVTGWHRDRELSVDGVSRGHMAPLVLQRGLRMSRGRLIQIRKRPHVLPADPVESGLRHPRAVCAPTPD